MARTRDELNDKHAGIMRFIVQHRDNKGYPPTIREIQHSQGLSSTSVVFYYLDRLENEGFIEREIGNIRAGARAIRVLPAGEEYIKGEENE